MIRLNWTGFSEHLLSRIYPRYVGMFRTKYTSDQLSMSGESRLFYRTQRAWPIINGMSMMNETVLIVKRYDSMTTFKPAFFGGQNYTRSKSGFLLWGSKWLPVLCNRLLKFFFWNNLVIVLRVANTNVIAIVQHLTLTPTDEELQLNTQWKKKL